MNQQINLYLPEFRVKKDPLTVLLMGQILGGVVVIMLLISAFQLFSRWQANSTLADLQASLIEETRKTDELDEVLARRSQSQELTNRLDAAEVQLQSRRLIRDFLRDTQLGNVVGFSEYLKDLSRASIDGLSLSEFALRNGGASVSISGETTDSAMVPRYVSNLEAGQSPLKTKQFSPSVFRGDATEQYFNFSLSSTNE